MNKRNSNIEFLRIICILAIISMHVFGEFINDLDTLGKSAMIFNNGICNFGTSVFMLISGYYGLRYNREKLVKLWIVALFWSIALMFLRPDYSLKYIVKSFFPVLTCKYWFLTVYIIILCLSTYLEDFLSRLERRQFQQLLLILIFFFYIAPTFLMFEIMKDSGKGIANMLTVYIVGRYLHKYNILQQLPLKKLGVGLIGVVILSVSINILVTLHTGMMFGMMSRDNNLLTLVGAICIFGICLKIKQMSNSFINGLASYVFPLYIIHYALIPKFIIIPESTKGTLYLMIWLNTLSIFSMSILLEFVRRILLDKLFSKSVGFGLFLMDNFSSKKI